MRAPRREFCSVCLTSHTDFVTEIIDQRTPAEIAAGRAPVLVRFHYCQQHAPDPCPVCGGDHDRITRDDAPACYDELHRGHRATLARQLKHDRQVTA
jgi:hypothetical protein